MEVIPSALDLFQTPPIQASILGNRVISYKPISSIDNQSVLEFLVKDSGDSYKDLNGIHLNIKVKICRINGLDNDVATQNQAGVVNNLLHSLFDQCNVYFNGTLVTPSEDNYHYRAYLENLLNYGKDAASTHLVCDGWVLDSGEDINAQGTVNAGFTERKGWFLNSTTVELEGRLHADVFNQPKYLLNGVDVGVKLSMAKPSFYIKEADGATSVLKILDATLYVPHIEINPSIMLAHNAALSKTNAKYPYKRVEIKTFTIPAGSHMISQDNMLFGSVPDTLIFTMVDNDSFVGRRSKNPFAFSHYSLTDFSLLVNGVQIPAQGLSSDFSDRGYWTRAYRSLYSGIGYNHSDKGNQINKYMFAHGYFVLAFDLTPDSSGNEDHISVMNRGNVRIDARFEHPLANTITCIVYAEYNASIEIDKQRNIITHFS